jgi:glycerol-3-phosphate dehydrogenase
LRYLRNYEFRLVHEAVVERQRMLRMAPHLVHPLKFVFPVYAGDPDPPWKLNLGLTVYDVFGGLSNTSRHRMYRAERLLQMEPLLRRDGLLGGGVYTDSATDDGRLVIEVLQSAVQEGVVVANYAEVEALLDDGHGQVAGARARDRLSGQRFAVRAARVLSAAGPWADEVRRLEDPCAEPLLRLTKGVHISLVRSCLPVHHAVTIRGEDGRIMFAVPSGAYTYVGTTDTDYTGDPDMAGIDWPDVAYILRALAQTLPAAPVGPADVVGAWVGLRPLIASDIADPSAASRDYRLYQGRRGLITVAGGKLTAFRAMASHIVDDLYPDSRGRRRQRRSRSRLPGAPDARPEPGLVERLATELDEPAEEVLRVVNRYGAAFPEVLADYHARRQRPARRAWRLAQLRRAVSAEMAMRLTDVYRRRTSLLLFSPDNGLDDLRELAEEMGRLLCWSRQRVDDEVAEVQALADQMLAWRTQVR